jgi:hypothetical protein
MMGIWVLLVFLNIIRMKGKGKRIFNPECHSCAEFIPISRDRNPVSRSGCLSS